MELLLTVLKLLWAVRGERTGCQRGGPPARAPGGAADVGWGGLAARLLTGTPAKPPEPARPPAHEGEGVSPLIKRVELALGTGDHRAWLVPGSRVRFPVPR